MLTLELPDYALSHPAATFYQSGAFRMAGSREDCEQCARAIGGLYCLITDGRAVIRFDFEDRE